MSPYQFFTTVDQKGLNDLNTTNYRIVVATRLTTLAVLVALGVLVWEVLHGHHEQAATFLEYTFIFLTALLGLGVGQYGLKRFSDSGFAAAKASAAPASVVQTTGTVVQQNPGGPVATGAQAAPVAAVVAPVEGPEARDAIDGIEPAP